MKSFIALTLLLAIAQFWQAEALLCARQCPLTKQPVCATNNQGKLITFENLCLFENTQCAQTNLQWTVVHHTECSQEILRPSPRQSTLCARQCPISRLDTVCGRNNKGEVREFLNPCLFQNVQCAQTQLQWDVVSHDKCRQSVIVANMLCAKQCPFTKQPVCGTNNKGELETFRNLCFFENAQCAQTHLNWNVIRHEACQKVQEVSENLLCAKLCPLNWQPVCAKNNQGKLETFQNLCSFENTQCSQTHLEWNVIRKEECEKVSENLLCAKRCPMTREPVCGKNNKGELETFQNLCLFENTQCSQTHLEWNVIRKEECQKASENLLCAKRCPLNRQPVCGKNNKGQLETFQNLCLFENAQCSQTHLEWNVIRHEECPKLNEMRLCARRCPLIRQPVCGQNNNGLFEIFQNQCLFENTQCSQPNNQWRLVQWTECRPEEIDAQKSRSL